MTTTKEELCIKAVSVFSKLIAIDQEEAQPLSKKSKQEIVLSATEAFEITCAAFRYFFGQTPCTGDRHNEAYLATKYAKMVYEVANTLKAEHGEAFDADAIADALDEEDPIDD
jgi:hypothetical protein